MKKLMFLASLAIVSTNISGLENLHNQNSENGNHNDNMMSFDSNSQESSDNSEDTDKSSYNQIIQNLLQTIITQKEFINSLESKIQQLSSNQQLISNIIQNMNDLNISLMYPFNLINPSMALYSNPNFLLNNSSVPTNSLNLSYYNFFWSQNLFTSLSSNLNQLGNNPTASKPPQWYQLLKLPDYPQGYEERFFNAIEKDFGIEVEVAKKIIKEWRIIELGIFESIEELTIDKLRKLRRIDKKLSISDDFILSTLFSKMRKARKDLCNKYKDHDFNQKNINCLITYHSYMLMRYDNNCSSHYQCIRSCNNNSTLALKALSWLEQHRLAVRKRIRSQPLLAPDFENLVYGVVQKYNNAMKTEKDIMFPEAVQSLRKQGLTDKKIEYNLNYFKKKTDTEESKARMYLRNTFNTELEQYGNLEARRKSVYLLKKERVSCVQIKKLLGIFRSSLDSIPSFEKRDIKAEIAEILDEYDINRANVFEQKSNCYENLSKNVSKAAYKLYHQIGFNAQRVIELLELPYTVYCTEEKASKAFSKHKKIEAKNPKAIKDAREKNIISLYKRGWKCWQIADFFGVKRDVVRKHIMNVEEEAQEEDSTRKRNSNPEPISTPQKKLNKGKQPEESETSTATPVTEEIVLSLLNNVRGYL